MADINARLAHLFKLAEAAYESDDTARGDYYARLWLNLLHVKEYLETCEQDCCADEVLTKNLMCDALADSHILQIAVFG